MPTNIIMERDAVIDRIRRRNYGADDYLVQAFLRRSAARFRPQACGLIRWYRTLSQTFILWRMAASASDRRNAFSRLLKTIFVTRNCLTESCHSELVEERDVRKAPIIKAIPRHTPSRHKSKGRISQAQHDNSESIRI